MVTEEIQESSEQKDALDDLREVDGIALSD